MRDNIQLAREKTRNSVADITGWCLIVALHQLWHGARPAGTAGGDD